MKIRFRKNQKYFYSKFVIFESFLYVFLDFLYPYSQSPTTCTHSTQVETGAHRYTHTHAYSFPYTLTKIP